LAVKAFERARYSLVSPLRVGGLAQSFLFDRERDGFAERVLLKQLLPTFASRSEVASAWLTRAEQASGVTHPHVVRVLDWGLDGQDAVVVVEHVESVSLDSMLRTLKADGSTLALGTALEIGRAVLSALGCIHDTAPGLLHLDVAPQSVLLAADGRIMLTEPGLWGALPAVEAARVRFDRGRAPYQSPEQTTGSAGDARSDLFAAGVVLYELLCGRRPFEGATQLVIAMAISEGRVTPLRSVAPQLPETLYDIVDHLLAHRPDERFQSANAAAAALSTIAAPHDPNTLRQLWARTQAATRALSAAPRDGNTELARPQFIPVSVPHSQPASPTAQHRTQLMAAVAMRPPPPASTPPASTPPPQRDGRTMIMGSLGLSPRPSSSPPAPVVPASPTPTPLVPASPTPTPTPLVPASATPTPSAPIAGAAPKSPRPPPLLHEPESVSDRLSPVPPPLVSPPPMAPSVAAPRLEPAPTPGAPPSSMPAVPGFDAASWAASMSASDGRTVNLRPAATQPTVPALAGRLNPEAEPPPPLQTPPPSQPSFGLPTPIPPSSPAMAPPTPAENLVYQPLPFATSPQSFPSSPAPVNAPIPSFAPPSTLASPPTSQGKWQEPSHTLFNVKPISKQPTQRRRAKTPLAAVIGLAVAFGFALVLGGYLFYRLTQ
jgi:hypothetical protein